MKKILICLLILVSLTSTLYATNSWNHIGASLSTSKSDSRPFLGLDFNGQYNSINSYVGIGYSAQFGMDFFNSLSTFYASGSVGIAFSSNILTNVYMSLILGPSISTTFTTSKLNYFNVGVDANLLLGLTINDNLSLYVNSSFGAELYDFVARKSKFDALYLKSGISIGLGYSFAKEKEENSYIFY